MIHTLILPGLDGSPAPHWQHWWAQRDPHALLVEQLDWSRPTPDAWEAEVAGAVLAHPDCVLVGHSLGAILAARVLAQWPQLRIRGALLVAPADPCLSDRLKRFCPIVQRSLGVPVTVVASRNDPWMPFSRARQLAQSWDAQLIDLGFAGHINVESGFGPWPLGPQLRDDLRRASPIPAPRRRPLYHARGWSF